jgi:hypothetical protein
MIGALARSGATVSHLQPSVRAADVFFIPPRVQ